MNISGIFNYFRDINEIQVPDNIVNTKGAKLSKISDDFVKSNCSINNLFDSNGNIVKKVVTDADNKVQSEICYDGSHVSYITKYKYGADGKIAQKMVVNFNADGNTDFYTIDENFDENGASHKTIEVVYSSDGSYSEKIYELNAFGAPLKEEDNFYDKDENFIYGFKSSREYDSDGGIINTHIKYLNSAKEVIKEYISDEIGHIKQI